MRAPAIVTALGMALLLPLSSTSRVTASSRALTFEDRVRAQEAIERVYYAHLEGARRSFEQAMTPDVLERKVRTYLKQSEALEAYWHTSISAEMLRREAERIDRGSRFPERLREIDAALGHDSFLIQETLVRAALVDRMARSLLSHDERIQGAARAEAESIRAQLAGGMLLPTDDHPRRTVLEVNVLTAGQDSPEASSRPPLEAIRSPRLMRVDASMEEMRRFRQSAPSQPGEIGPVNEEAGSFTVKVLLAEETGMARIASYIVPKVTWEMWWAAHAAEFDETLVPSVAEAGGASLGAQSASPGATICGKDNTWDNGSLDDMPDARYLHTAVWTGTEMIVWGGQTYWSLSANGGRYDPLIDSWRSLSLAGAPTQLPQSTAVWTGQEMIVWGGQSSVPGVGGRYDPATDTWRPLSSVGEPATRFGHSAVWTGSEMIIWGGRDSSGVLGTGVRYDPAVDRWSPLSTTGAPRARLNHAAVWTGREMIVWGGDGGQSSTDFIGTGGRYDPAADAWSPTSSVNAPAPRIEHTAVWTGSEMIVWGGTIIGGNRLPEAVGSGARYDPIADTWTPTSVAGVTIPRRGHTAVWTGARMILWGGSDTTYRGAVGFLNRFASLYDPQADRWTDSSDLNSPFNRMQHTAIWTGTQMIVWGGQIQDGPVRAESSGGRYDPVSDTWTPTSRRADGVDIPGTGSVVWTGDEMLVWSYGPNGLTAGTPGSGARYDPLVDSWRPIATAGAPETRVFHVGVWTGDEMIVWGGYGPSGYPAAGGRYDPATDTWRGLSQTGAPVPRAYGNAVWTGQEMLVWGGDRCVVGCYGLPYTIDGGRYDPARDSWRPIASQGAPQPLRGFSIVWTGQEMIVWGGYLCSNSSCLTYFPDAGGRYDPQHDRWLPLPPLPAGQGRSGHTAVWTGREMLVMGGGSNVTPPYALPAWSYDRAADAWSQFPTLFPPQNRSGHSAVWTGRQMIVWGGSFPFSLPGLVYEPVSRTWSVLSAEGQPLDRTGHAAFWTGSSMIVWGGSSGTSELRSGGRLIFGQDSDDDGDGLSECQGDCDDTDALVYPGAAERCNGRDDNCNGIIDEDANGLDTDGDGTPNACDACPAFANPGQTDPDACIAVGAGSGQCLAAGVQLPETIPEGEVTLVHQTAGPPDTIHFTMNVSSCDRIDPIEFLLNGTVIATFTEPQQSCACVPPPYHATAGDAALLRSLWRPAGPNVLGIRKAGAISPPGTYLGTYVGWVKATLESGSVDAQQSVCLVDFIGGGCTQPNQCYGSATEDALDLSIPVTGQLPIEETLSRTPFTNGALPRSIDVHAVADGPMQLCVGATGPARLYAAQADGGLYQIDPGTAAATAAGSLTQGLVEMAHDDVSHRSFAQTSGPGGGMLEAVDILKQKAPAASPFLGLPLTGMEFVNGVLYGVDSRSGGGRVMVIDPDSGYSEVRINLGAGTWIGLAYDHAAGLFLTSRTLNAASTLWSLDAFTGEARQLQDLPFQPAALEFGPDGILYLAHPVASDTELYRRDAGTGDFLLVGRMGISDVAALATVKNYPRGCLDIVKQGESSLGINGGCNSPPTASAGADQRAECTSASGATVVLDATGSSDPDSTPGTQDDIVLVEWFEDFGLPAQRLLGAGWTLPVALPLGTHHVTLLATDKAGATGTDEVDVAVVDTTPPQLTASLSPAILWPPNHRMVDVTAAVTATDACSTPAVFLMSVTSSEPDDAAGPGDGATSGDVAGVDLGTADFNLALRAERDGAGRGRVYSITYEAVDGSGNTAEASLAATVPHDQGGVTEPVDISVRETAAGTQLIWSDVPGAIFYNVVRGDVSFLRDAGDQIDLGDLACVRAGSSAPDTAGFEDAALPPAGGVYFYLVEYNDGWGSSYGEPSAAKPRVVTSGGCH